jgi:valyl-tRNA synthetase
VETKNDIFPLVVDDPMLLFSDVAVMIHNNDKRYKKHL